MKGTLHKTENGWHVINMQATLNGPLLQSLPLHPDNVNQIIEDSKVFDNIEARIKAYPDVEFEIVEIIAPVEDGTTMYKCAKLTPFISNNIQIGSEGVYKHVNSDTLKK
jgi:hypothetical protein